MFWSCDWVTSPVELAVIWAPKWGFDYQTCRYVFQRCRPELGAKNRLSERGPGCERDLLVCCWSVSLASTESKTKPHSKGGKWKTGTFPGALWWHLIKAERREENKGEISFWKVLKWVILCVNCHWKPVDIYLLTCWGLGAYSVNCLLCFSLLCLMFAFLPFLQASLWYFLNWAEKWEGPHKPSTPLSSYWGLIFIHPRRGGDCSYAITSVPNAWVVSASWRVSLFFNPKCTWGAAGGA